MCTVSWFHTELGYELFFNRDEQKSRPTALEPRRFKQNNIESLMPIDPLGGGSWIATNNQGITVCLLNYYQGCLPTTELKSRGLLIKHLSACHDLNAIQHLLSHTDLSYFAPFSLLVFGAKSAKKPPKVLAFQWNGRLFHSIDAVSPMISSSVDPIFVTEKRHSFYREMTSKGINRQSLRAFHNHHHPQQGHLSACMYREDASTVSLTHIIVNTQKSIMNYTSGSPCHTSKITAYEVKHEHQFSPPNYTQ